jgi:hypothetical protein
MFSLISFKVDSIFSLSKPTTATYLYDRHASLAVFFESRGRPRVALDVYPILQFYIRFRVLLGPDSARKLEIEKQARKGRSHGRFFGLNQLTS